MNRLYIYLAALLIIAGFNACEEDTIKAPELNDTTYDIMVDINEEKGIVSPLLMGFNNIYCFEKDAMWENGSGQLPEMFKRMNTGILRYPGGAVVNRYHWNNLNGQGWKDNWDPNYDPADDMPSTEFMDVDEYMANITAIGAEPMLGINMGSGLKYNRVQDGIDEAVALVQYCQDKGYDVTYWYLDNEAYHNGANYTMTPEEYAEQINLYVPAMKAVNPNIETIVNWDSKISTNSAGMEKLITLAGENINIMEVHWYWEFGTGTFNKWVNSYPMSSKNQWYSGLSYFREIMEFTPLLHRTGHTHIKLASNEWNLGPAPSDTETPSKFESALMISEQFSQFIDGGLFMANFWGVHWPTETSSPSVNRYLLDPTDSYSENPAVKVFEMFGEAMGKMQVRCSSLINGVYDVAVWDNDKNQLIIYLLNKNPNEVPLSTGIDLKGISAKVVTANSLIGSEDGTSSEMIQTIASIESASRVKLSLPQNSLTKVVISN